MPETAECVLCDWHYDPMGAPRAAYLPGQWLPLRWDGTGIRPVAPSDTIMSSVPWVALAHHWAHEHPEQLELALGGPAEIDVFPRSKVPAHL